MDERTLKVLEFDKIVRKVGSLAASALGKELAESLLPERSFVKVQNSLKETSDGESLIIRKGNPPLGGIHDIKDSLRRVGLGAVLSPGELLRISDTLKAVRNLKNYAGDEACEDGNNIVTELIGLLVPNRKIEDKINMAVIDEEEISDNASATLANIRKQMRQLKNSIRERLNDIIRSPRYQKFIQEPIVTMRQDRYVIPVKQEYKNEIPGLVHDSSSSGATIFIEPMSVVEANNDIKQLIIKEHS